MSAHVYCTARRTGITAGLSLGLAVAALDLALGLSDPGNAGEPRPLLRGAASAGALTVALYTPIAYALLSRFCRGGAGSGSSFALGLYAGVVASLALPVFARMGGGEMDLHVSLASLVVAGLFGCLVAALVGKYSCKGDETALAAAFCTASPLLAAAIAGLAWLRREFEQEASLRRLASAAVVLMSMAVLWGAWSFRRRLPAIALLSALLTLLLAASFMLPSGPRAADSTPRQPSPGKNSVKSILLITIDTLRADALSCLGAEKGATPAIDSLAADGVLFTQARSCAPWTLPAMASIMTGVAPEVHRTVGFNDGVPEGLRSLASYMRESGYRTAAFGTNNLLLRGRGFDRDFDEYAFFPMPHESTPLGGRLLEWIGAQRPYEPEADAAKLTNLACDWIQANPDDEFFIWIHYFDPHYPYFPPAVYRTASDPATFGALGTYGPAEIRAGRLVLNERQREHVRAMYRAEIRYLDDQLARMIDFLKSRNLYQDALVVLAADHGEEFWEHGLQEHGHSVYDEVIRVPLIVKVPGPIEPRRVETPVSTGQIPATIMELIGSGLPSGGAELPPLFTADAALAMPASAVFSSDLLYYENRTSVVFEGYKYIRWHISGREELYDLSVDPSELRPIQGEASDRLRTSRKLLEEHQLNTQSMRERLGLRVKEAALSPDSESQLRGLGYVK